MGANLLSKWFCLVSPARGVSVASTGAGLGVDVTSKLWNTLVGVGIALGGAPACLGRAHDSASESSAGGASGSAGSSVTGTGGAVGSGGATAGAATTAGSTSGGAPTGGGTSGASGAGATTGGVAGGGASGAGAPMAGQAGTAQAGTGGVPDGGMPIDPFCDVTWPPTKANPDPQAMPCVDPFNQCTDARLQNCYRALDGGACDRSDGRIAPLYCVEGAWQCPPGSLPPESCACFVWSDAALTCPSTGGTGGDGGAGGAP